MAHAVWGGKILCLPADQVTSNSDADIRVCCIFS